MIDSLAHQYAVYYCSLICTYSRPTYTQSYPISHQQKTWQTSRLLQT